MTRAGGERSSNGEIELTGIAPQEDKEGGQKSHELGDLIETAEGADELGQREWELETLTKARKVANRGTRTINR